MAHSEAPQPPRRLLFDGPVNFRDLGGYVGLGGRLTKWGMVYRSDALWRLTTQDRTAFDLLGIKRVYDLRGDEERALKPNPMESLQIDIERSVMRQEFEDGSHLTSPDVAEARLRHVYMAVLETAAPAFAQLLTALADDDDLPALFHCAGGKDRTGMAAALLLGLLGVDRATVLDDYVLTDACQTAGRRAEIEQMVIDAGMTAGAARWFVATHRVVLNDSLAWLDERYGDPTTYLRQAGGLSTDVIAVLRERLLD